jgi:epoxyqueuosine reductase QueG
MTPDELAALITDTIHQTIQQTDQITCYRTPVIGFLCADDPEFANLEELTGGSHLMPEDLLPGARSVVSYFLPFEPQIVYANQQDKEKPACQWAIAYKETNALIGTIAARLIEVLGEHGVKAAAEAATGKFSVDKLRDHWSHKSIAVMSGIGSFGLHQMVITDAGCCGRFGSLVLDAELPVNKPAHKERCEFFDLGTCMDCVLVCPVQALDEEQPFDRWACQQQLARNSQDFLDLGKVTVCGKCAVMGPCAVEAAV